MSHLFYLRCPRCRGSSEDGVNGGQEALAEAARKSYPLRLAHLARWDVQGVTHQDYALGYTSASTIDFLVRHWDHGGFQVVSEYWREGDPQAEAKYPPLFVTPEVPAGALYEAACLPSLVDDAKRVRDELAELLVRIDRAQDAALSEAQT